MAAMLFKPFLLVIDDFYPDPGRVYEMAKSFTYREVKGATGFRSAELYQETGIKQRFEKLLGRRITDWGTAGNSENGTFFLAFAGGKRREAIGIHTDPLINDVTIVIYITPNIPAECGTSFWKHRTTGVWHEPTAATAKSAGMPVKKLRDTLEREGGDKRKWEETDRVGYKYNRMIAFPSGMFHSGSRHFGKDIEGGGRIIQTFRLGVDWKGAW